jgi:rhamnulokinase
MIPDIFNYLMTGVAKAEFTDVSTTQCYDPRKRDWARPLMHRLGIPTHFLPEIVPPGTDLGAMHPKMAARLGVRGIRVVAPGCHDTASAVAAVPAEEKGSWAYLSSGTWSLMGAELAEPHITDEGSEFNFTNEGGIGGTFRFLKNISGLWLLQESLRYWKETDGVTISYSEAVKRAAAAPAFVSWVDPDDGMFNTPESMPAAIIAYCQQTKQRMPQSYDAILRTIFESLALKYRSIFNMMQKMRGSIQTLHIVGGGSANALLNQFSANALGIHVLAGPTEATAIGNLLVQAMALGEISSPGEIRAVVRKSFRIDSYEPRDVALWTEAYERWQEIVSRKLN